MVADPSTLILFEIDKPWLMQGYAVMGNSSDSFNGTWNRPGNESMTMHHGRIYRVKVANIGGSVKETTLSNADLWTRDYD
jgi:hypothetical protein